MHILMVGNPLDGVQIYGPFDDEAEALAYGERYFRNDTWWVPRLIEPK